jgi:hypothetical protein
MFRVWACVMCLTYGVILYIIYYTYTHTYTYIIIYYIIYYYSYILYYTLPVLLYLSSSPILFLSPIYLPRPKSHLPPILLSPWFILYVSGVQDPYLYTYGPHTSTIQNWPRTFYRSGWLRCDVFDVRSYIILIHTHTIYCYLILYSSFSFILFSHPL